MDQVTPQIKQHLKANMTLSKKEIIVNNFLGGLFWGFGSVVGAGVVVTVIGYILNALGIFSAIGNFFSQFLGPFAI
ncbi:MAG: hypothetical protein UU73_C0003G0245 [Candidatus Daviesbacteria bacterium GW2011_GWA1_41_61]|uniref:Uncharacterized protein n=1 Tax=Candidatus Daviesbacteria bacterium GW2011_GWA2_40_9 TaxID=1618424 RepID=A0A0G0U962_9BACT|nr:MAG: hypothetical protein UU29_C0001G0016 [Candidatus Daviesbacteria bacterium GW2011_GWA2_40_9]KKR93405.1 MAG: hypothetical protein UU44_C0002G0066 [Candidatus Daviesbacteria bacterium GW2011_GWB1_41_15]KKS15046.1 MAG: hypothetical protein UU73_C0003G0245 [Candidatus Daviesbacteria bacterium GW2011_GWA1_41_61]